MLLQSVDFLYFFAVVYAIAFLLNFAQHRLESFFPFKIYKVFLLAVSYYFYGYWDWRFVLILLVSTIVDYWVGIRIFDERLQHGNTNKFYIVFSLVINLGILGFFKYYNFFIDSANLALQNHGISFPHLTLILPLGLSFYIFETISYSIDVYRGKLQPTRDIVDFALYLAFFPHLLASPILRATDFLAQLLEPRKLTLKFFFDGLQVFLYGLFLKVVIADNIAPMIDPIFASPTSYDSVAAWVAVLGYSAQIFCDFFGYSEMAIGLALALGFILPTNFKAPYSATNLFEFWRRSHETLKPLY